MSLNVGASKVLTATVLPVGASQSVSWYTSDAAIATIDGSQNVIAKAPGVVDISARTPNGIESICKVTVSAVEVP